MFVYDFSYWIPKGFQISGFIQSASGYLESIDGSSCSGDQRIEVMCLCFYMDMNPTPLIGNLCRQSHVLQSATGESINVVLPSLGLRSRTSQLVVLKDRHCV